MYRIEFTRQALQALLKVPPKIKQLIKEKMDQIASDPYAKHNNVTKLQGRPGFRLRVGEWRVIYEIDKEKFIIVVLKVAPRGEVYK